MTVPFIRKNTQRNSSWPGESNLQIKAEYICADLSIRLHFSLAVVRRTIHFRELRRQVGSSIGRIVSELPTIQELVSSLTDRPEFFVLFENPTLREGSTTQFLVLQVSVGLELDSALKRDAARGAVSSEADAEQTCGG